MRPATRQSLPPRMLADQADKNGQTVIPVYETPEPRQHVAQQQQQPQPDDEKEE